MLIKWNSKLTVILLVVALAASLLSCAGTGANANNKNTPTSTNQQAPAQGQPGQPPDMTNQPVEQKLAIGTLKLEGTANAVTAEQAKALLPVWKAVKAMSNDANASTDEINALYTQISESMTAEQIQAIKDMTISQDDIQALMKTYNIKMPQMGQGRMAGTQTAGGTTGARDGAQAGGMPGSDMGGPGAGGPPPDIASGMPSADQNGAAPASQRTPQVGRWNRGFRGGFNNLFIDPLIKLLTERVGA